MNRQQRVKVAEHTLTIIEEGSYFKQLLLKGGKFKDSFNKIVFAGLYRSKNKSTYKAFLSILD